MFVILFGAPGVGKGTQAELVASRNNIAHLSTGDEFRRNIKEQTHLGKQVAAIVDAGQLVPDEMVTAIVSDCLNSTKFAGGCLFDGFPRTIAQAQALDAILREKRESISLVINIDVMESAIVERLLKRGRADDVESVVRHRLDVYRQQTEPVLSYYAQQEKLKSVDGNADVETVNERIQKILSENK